MSVSRRTVITVAAIVVGVALVVALVVAGIAARPGSSKATGDTPTSSATYTSAPTVRPTATSGTGTGTGTGTDSVAPTEIPASGTQDVPGSTPSATADSGTASGLAQKPVSFATTTTLTSDVDVSLKNVASVAGKGDGVGEVSGPSVRFTVTIVNRSKAVLDLTSTVVSVSYGSGETPSNELASSRKPFGRTVAAGATAQATYTFPVPVAQRSAVRIIVDYGVSLPSVVFAGKAPA